MGKNKPQRKKPPPKPAAQEDEPKVYEIFDDSDEEKDIDAITEEPEKKVELKQEKKSEEPQKVVKNGPSPSKQGNTNIRSYYYIDTVIKFPIFSFEKVLRKLGSTIQYGIY